MRLVRCEDGRLEIALEPSARKTLVSDLSKKLAVWTGRRWMVAVSAEAGAPTMRAQSGRRKAELEDGVRADPLVQAVLARFPGAEIVEVVRRPDRRLTPRTDASTRTRRAGGRRFDGKAATTMPTISPDPMNVRSWNRWRISWA